MKLKHGSGTRYNLDCKIEDFLRLSAIHKEGIFLRAGESLVYIAQGRQGELLSVRDVDDLDV